VHRQRRGRRSRLSPGPGDVQHNPVPVAGGRRGVSGDCAQELTASVDFCSCPRQSAVRTHPHGPPPSAPIRGRFAVFAYLPDAAPCELHGDGLYALASVTALHPPRGPLRRHTPKDGDWHIGNPGHCCDFEGVPRQNSHGALVIVRECTRHSVESNLVGMISPATDVFPRSLRTPHLNGIAGRVTRDTPAGKASAALPRAAWERRA